MNVVAMTKTGDGIVLQAAPGIPEARPASLAQMVEEVKALLGEVWLPRIYVERILPMRTRSHRLPATTKKDAVDVQHTLLGVELKIGRHRMSCPDLATARYLAVFARAGCTDVAVPYDISRISRLADELESSWHRMLLLIEHVAGRREQSFRSRLRNLLVKDARRGIAEAGAGTAIPQFNQNTRQRRA